MAAVGDRGLEDCVAHPSCRVSPGYDLPPFAIVVRIQGPDGQTHYDRCGRQAYCQEAPFTPMLPYTWVLKLSLLAFAHLPVTTSIKFE